MGPANDYWPTDLGGTMRARAMHKLIYACVYERHDPFALASFTSITQTVG